MTATLQQLANEEDNARQLDRKLQREQERRVELQADIAALDARLDAEATKTEELQAAVSRAVAARSRAELEMEFLQDELESLRIRDLPRDPEPTAPAEEPPPES